MGGVRRRVLKFGGTSVGTAEALRSAAAITAASSRETAVVVVVSALSGVTNQLESAVSDAAAGTLDARACARALAERHLALLSEVASPREASPAAEAVARRVTELESRLVTIRAKGSASPATRAGVVALGERLALPVATAALRSRGLDAHAIDASDVVRTRHAYPEAEVDYPATRQLARTTLSVLPPTSLAVVTGFIASAASGATTLLGRGGSDLTAAVLGWALDADRGEIWSDVDGVMTADPRHSPGARTIPRLTYAEAATMARAGAKVLHPRTLEPLERPGIPVFVGNTLRPWAPGTWIGPGPCP
jgi:aspartate kinase